jgi:hypothetical protein
MNHPQRCFEGSYSTELTYTASNIVLFILQATDVRQLSKRYNVFRKEELSVMSLSGAVLPSAASHFL